MVFERGLALIISMQLVLYCFLIGSIYLLLISLSLDYLGKKLNLYKGIPPVILEESGVSWFIIYYLMEFLFFIVIPTIGYSFFYLILPFAGIKAGMAIALFAFILGAVPVIMGLSIRIKLPVTYLLYFLFGYLIKLGGAMIIIGYLYTL